jgi:hypothetical protein
MSLDVLLTTSNDSRFTRESVTTCCFLKSLKGRYGHLSWAACPCWPTKARTNQIISWSKRDERA